MFEDSVRGGIPKDVDCNYSVPFVREGRIQSKKPIPIDRHGIILRGSLGEEKVLVREKEGKRIVP